MKFEFDETALRQVMSQVLFEQFLTPEKRDEMVQTAIADLLKDKEIKNGYSVKRVSVISEAFDHAAREVAQEVIKEEIGKSEEFRDAVRHVMSQAIAAMLTDESVGTAASKVIVDLIAKGIEDYRYFKPS